ncbi:hypothetical protein [Pseudoduganella sp. GCM10020061]|uniref:hypothetical protein n=1 Tax=Pseudoduganella sp. GCM10020061 TaxID=3317345 RepID=UPI003627DAC9
MKRVYRSIMLSGLLGLPGLAFADPSFNSYWSGSHFFIDATNSEQREFSCSVTYSFEYMDFGTKKLRSESGHFVVKAARKNGETIEPWRGNVLRLTGSWVQPVTVGGPNIQCS